jgi:hypothetical protein
MKERGRSFYAVGDANNTRIYEGDHIYNMYTGRDSFGIVKLTEAGWTVVDYAADELLLILVLQNPKIKINEK